MRITFILPSDNLSGGTRVVAIYAQQLVARGHQVLVVTGAPDRLSLRQKLRAILKRDWALLRNDGRSQPGHVALSGVAHKILVRSCGVTASDVPDADFIVGTWWEIAVQMHRLPASKGRKVHLIQGYEVWVNPQATAQVDAALRLPNLKIAISSDLKHTIEGKLGPLGIHVVPNAVDLTQFNAPPRSKQGSPTVGFVYAVAPIKGADICARACELARLQVPELRVVAFGADPASAEVPLPKDTAFFLRPAQDQLKEIYASCDAWLFGSRLDSFGLPILEAMACRTPVIAVPIGAAADLLGDGTGVLVAKESPEEMAAAIVAMCRQSAPDWQTCSARAHRKAHGYSWDDAANLFLAALGTA
jgi:glycosyltransferase involved in cell wall biosynthesis